MSDWWIELRCSLMARGCRADADPILGWLVERKALEVEARKKGWVKKNGHWLCKHCKMAMVLRHEAKQETQT